MPQFITCCYVLIPSSQDSSLPNHHLTSVQFASTWQNSFTQIMQCNISCWNFKLLLLVDEVRDWANINSKQASLKQNCSMLRPFHRFWHSWSMSHQQESLVVYHSLILKILNDKQLAKGQMQAWSLLDQQVSYLQGMCRGAMQQQHVQPIITNPRSWSLNYYLMNQRWKIERAGKRRLSICCCLWRSP